MLVTALPALAVITEPDNHKAIFRYRTYTGTKPDYVSPLTAAGGIDRSAGSSDIVTIDRGVGFRRHDRDRFWRGHRICPGSVGDRYDG